MRRELFTLVLAAALVACDDPTQSRTLGLDQPTAVAVFTGITGKRPGELHPYLAIANGGRDDLTLVDVVDGEAVLAPVLVRPLAVPTVGQTHPTQLVSASLRDGGADLLVVAPAGAPVLQVVRTWTDDTRVVPELEVDLSAIAPGAEIVAAVAVPIPLDGTPAATPGRARLVVALTGDRLGVVDYVREPGGGIRREEPKLQPLPFQPASLGASPDARRLFAATTDDLPAGSGIHGVVELDAAGEPGTWTATMLPTRGPTRLVATARVQERRWAENDLAIPEDAPWVLRVYAALDPRGCGQDRPIDCGIAVVDPDPPVRGLAADPLGEMPYQPPIRLPAEPVALSVAIPPAVPPEGFQPGRMAIFTAGDLQETTGVLVAPAADGSVYTVDLGRRTIWSESSLVRDVNPNSPNRLRVASVGNVFPKDRLKFEEQQTFRLFNCDRTKPGRPCTITLVGDAVEESVGVGPGYLYGQTVRVLYRGPIPGLLGRQAEVGDEGGLLWLAVQVPTSAGPTNVARLYDPALGVHAGDLVDVETHGFAPEACGVEDDEETTDVDESEVDLWRGTVAGFLPPDPVRFPGGAVLVADDGSACYDALRAGQAGLRTTVRGGGFVVTGSVAGYLGRGIVISPPGDLANLRVRVVLQYRNEDAPELACPLSPWPEDASGVVCDDDCRARCEGLALARKTRRWYVLADLCGAESACRERWGTPSGPVNSEGRYTNFSEPFPNYTGPALELLFTVRDPDRNAPLDGKDPEFLREGHGIALGVTSPYSPTSRVPTLGSAVLPTGAAPWDASVWLPSASYRFFVPYTSDLVLGFSPANGFSSDANFR